MKHLCVFFDSSCHGQHAVGWNGMTFSPLNLDHKYRTAALLFGAGAG